MATTIICPTCKARLKRAATRSARLICTACGACACVTCRDPRSAVDADRRSYDSERQSERAKKLSRTLPTGPGTFVC